MKKTRRKFDADFKRQAISMVTVGGKSCRAVERDLGISEGIVYRWVREANQDPKNAFPGNGNIKPSMADVHNLLKENEQLRRQRDILKKALAIFSHSRGRAPSAGRAAGCRPADPGARRPDAPVRGIARARGSGPRLPVARRSRTGRACPRRRGPGRPAGRARFAEAGGREAKVVTCVSGKRVSCADQGIAVDLSGATLSAVHGSPG